MTQLIDFKQDLEKTIHIIKSFFQVDVAIFDLQSRLVACTEDYLIQKGNTVHAPSIEEVVRNGNVVVNKPGYMPTCSGCRFIGNCPAKIEILRSIHTGTKPLGVMTFTSFSREGHERISRGLSVFVDALTIFSDWIAQLITQKQKSSQLDETGEILNILMDITRESTLVIDTHGIVKKCNLQAQKLFSFCDLYTRSGYSILPGHVMDKILAGNRLKNIQLKINHRPAFVSASPVLVNNEFKGAALSISITDDTVFPRENNVYDNPEQTDPDLYFSGMLGECPEIIEIKKKVVRLSRSSATILITGETGTGKGLLAKTIHLSSTRARGPFVPVNCASIPDTLFESELFGYDEGAFTGAKKGGKPGRFELAEGGTLFLDEIGEMPLHMQVKLLNVLQDYAFQRVGGITPISIDVRIIAATNQDLDLLVKEKKFRIDLFYRLNVIPIFLPPLSNRKHDIKLLTLAFLKEFNSKTGKDIKKISKPVMSLLNSHAWPGNIRELQNIMEYSINMEETDTITINSLPQRFLTYFTALAPDASKITAIDSQTKIKSRVMKTELDTILVALDRNGHDVPGKTLTARELGISLRTLYRKLKHHVPQDNEISQN